MNITSPLYTYDESEPLERIRQSKKLFSSHKQLTSNSSVAVIYYVHLVNKLEAQVELVNNPEETLQITEMPITSITRELQPDGSFKWYAVDPETSIRIEIDAADAWFWTPEWQAGEREVDEDLAAGRYWIVDNLDDLFNSL